VVSSSGAAGAGSCDDRIGGLDSVESAVRDLVQLVRRQHPQSSNPNHVLLDLLVDDVRCRLEMSESTPVAPVGGLLSRRETEVALMVAQGYPNKTIAAVLEISSFTVSSYLRRIFAKLGVNSRAAMVAQALEHRLLPAPVTRTDQSHTDPASDDGR
jgi:DNA-binding CsgD family transcriptional regulator